MKHKKIFQDDLGSGLEGEAKGGNSENAEWRIGETDEALEKYKVNHLQNEHLRRFVEIAGQVRMKQALLAIEHQLYETNLKTGPAGHNRAHRREAPNAWRLRGDAESNSARLQCRLQLLPAGTRRQKYRIHFIHRFQQPEPCACLGMSTTPPYFSWASTWRRHRLRTSRTALCLSSSSSSTTTCLLSGLISSCSSVFRLLLCEGETSCVCYSTDGTVLYAGLVRPFLSESSEGRKLRGLGSPGGLLLLHILSALARRQR